MGRYVLRRLLESAVTFVLVTIVVFLGVRALPGDPARTLAGEESDPATVEQIHHSYGLDRPLPVQYARYVQKALTGDLGRSPRTGLSVRDTIGHALPVTLQLAKHDPHDCSDVEKSVQAVCRLSPRLQKFGCVGATDVHPVQLKLAGKHPPPFSQKMSLGGQD